jgi:hypothetical protein
VLERVINRLWLRFTLVFFEVGLELLLGLVEVEKKFLARAEGQAANVAISHAGDLADEAGDLEVAIGHSNIMAGGRGSGQIRNQRSRRSPAGVSYWDK